MKYAKNMKLDIKAVRNKTGLTNVEIAEKIGVNKQWLSNMENPDKFPKTLKTIVKLSNLSKISINKLIK